MKNIKKRSYNQSESDLIAIAELINSCNLADNLDRRCSTVELRSQFNNPSIDTIKDLLLWENANGELIGFSQISIPPYEENNGLLEFYVHPQVRGNNLEKQITTAFFK
jgi:mycothiol synthase